LRRGTWSLPQQIFSPAMPRSHWPQLAFCVKACIKTISDLLAREMERKLFTVSCWAVVRLGLGPQASLNISLDELHSSKSQIWPRSHLVWIESDGLTGNSPCSEHWEHSKLLHGLDRVAARSAPATFLAIAQLNTFRLGIDTPDAFCYGTMTETMDH
jgi:hypothetical protein